MRAFIAAFTVGLLIACGPTAAARPPAPSPTLRTYPAHQPTPESTEPGTPVRLRIPSIKVDSPIMVVGLMQDGTVGTPCDPTKPAAPCNTNATAWYNGSSKPGAPGGAVIDGHVDWYGPAGATHSIPAVFADLKSLKRGAQVNVVDNYRITRTFVVDRVTTLPWPQQPPDTYATDGPASVTLITCEGAYVSRSRGMSSRLYVHAVLVGGIA